VPHSEIVAILSSYRNNKLFVDKPSMILKLFLWACFVCIIAFFSHKQLSMQVVSFEQTIFIPGNSKLDVYEYFKDVQTSMKNIQNGDT
jgi:hypothetical protein